jgi:UDP-glucose 4-epimerase
MVLVIGGAGYIGSHVCRLLRLAGEPHLAFDNLERGFQASLPGTRLIVGDLRDPQALKRLFAERPDIDVVMHFAAYIEVGESVLHPARFWRNNTYGVMVLLEAMREAGLDKIVFSSTAAIYGEPQAVPIPETHPTLPTSPYGDTKLAVERMLEAFDAAYGLRSVRLRYFNAAGAAEGGQIGEAHDPETHLIPRAILAAMGALPELKVFGTDYDTPDGTCLRDYVHVDDLAEAHLLAVRWLRDGGASRTFNLGNGEGCSVRQVIGAVSRATGLSVPHGEAPRRAGDPARLIASSEAIQREFGWRPRYAELDAIVRTAWEWHRGHPRGYTT